MKLSIITVCYNSAQFIAQAIESVLGQKHKNIEYVIVDGGSCDGTIEIIRRYAEIDSRIRWISEPDRGIADAMNKGVAMATGEVIAHLNSDDYYAHHHVVSIVADCFSRDNTLSWLTGGFTFVSEEGTFIRDIRVRKYSFARLVRANILLHPATFIRRGLFNAVGGFNCSLRYCMDYDLFLRLGRIAPPLTLDKQLTCFRVHAGSRSVSESEQAFAEEFQVRMNYLRSGGRNIAFYYLDYQIKRQLNRLFYRGLLSANQFGRKHE